MKALWNGKIIAESEKTIELENVLYFPLESLDRQLLRPSETTTTCPWKGQATYWDVSVDGETARDAAYAYESPKEAAKHIEGYVAFWRGVEISE